MTGAWGLSQPADLFFLRLHWRVSEHYACKKRCMRGAHVAILEFVFLLAVSYRLLARSYSFVGIAFGGLICDAVPPTRNRNKQPFFLALPSPTQPLRRLQSKSSPIRPRFKGPRMRSEREPCCNWASIDSRPTKWAGSLCIPLVTQSQQITTLAIPAIGCWYGV